jgi:hypothetical protein
MTLFTIGLIATEAIAIILLVDLIAGAVHWAEDTFWTERTPFVGSWLVKPNIIHHTPEGANTFLQNHWIHSSWDLFVAGPMILLATWSAGILTWQVWTFVLVGACSQQIHRFSHTAPTQLPRIVKFLQAIYVIQNSRHHWIHHGGGRNEHYCVITPFLNPVLDRLRFWRALERIFVPIFGAPRRTDLYDKEWFPCNTG